MVSYLVYLRVQVNYWEEPKQADSRTELRKLLVIDHQVASSSRRFRIRFKKDEDKFPALTDRHNIIVIADEIEPNMGSKQGRW